MPLGERLSIPEYLPLAAPTIPSSAQSFEKIRYRIYHGFPIFNGSGQPVFYLWVEK